MGVYINPAGLAMEYIANHFRKLSPTFEDTRSLSPVRMKSVIFCFLLTVAVCSAKPRSKREAFDLPDGAELLVGSVRTNFACPQNSVGYYADTDNDCKIFHVCNTVYQEDGTVETQQYSFLCGNQTVFNQLSFTCSMPEDAVPCNQATSFYYLNENLRQGDPKALFLDEQDVQRAAPLVPNFNPFGVRV